MEAPRPPQLSIPKFTKSRPSTPRIDAHGLNRTLQPFLSDHSMFHLSSIYLVFILSFILRIYITPRQEINWGALPSQPRLKREDLSDWWNSVGLIRGNEPSSSGELLQMEGIVAKLLPRGTKNSSLIAELQIATKNYFVGFERHIINFH